MTICQNFPPSLYKMYQQKPVIGFALWNYGSVFMHSTFSGYFIVH